MDPVESNYNTAPPVSTQFKEEPKPYQHHLFKTPEEEREIMKIIDETENMTEEEKINYFRVLKRRKYRVDSFSSNDYTTTPGNREDRP